MYKGNSFNKGKGKNGKTSLGQQQYPFNQKGYKGQGKSIHGVETHPETITAEGAWQTVGANAINPGYYEESFNTSNGSGMCLGQIAEDQAQNDQGRGQEYHQEGLTEPGCYEVIAHDTRPKLGNWCTEVSKKEKQGDQKKAAKAKNAKRSLKRAEGGQDQSGK